MNVELTLGQRLALCQYLEQWPTKPFAMILLDLKQQDERSFVLSRYHYDMALREIGLAIQQLANLIDINCLEKEPS